MSPSKAATHNERHQHELHALQALGWWPWQSRAVASEQLVSEVADWQRAQGLTPDGACGPATWQRLRETHLPRGWLPRLPRGLAEIERTYGKVGEVRPTRAPIFAGSGRAVPIHPALADEFPRLLQLAAELSGYTPADIQTYNVRRKRGGDNPGTAYSTHSWAIAFDADPARNPWGNKPSSPLIKHPMFLAVFRAAGWRCGADWKTPDTMHIQACWGY